MEYQAFSVTNFRKIQHVQKYLTEEEMFAIEVVGQVLPFKVNNYVVNELINWDNWNRDNIYALTFPSASMLKQQQFGLVRKALQESWSREELKILCNSIRMTLNPNPARQMDLNVPQLAGARLSGVQHKYDQTVLFFPTQGQTCHAYCTFCFRWPQFVGQDELKFSMSEVNLLVEYLKRHPKVTDLLITGGDPLIMRTSVLEKYLSVILKADLPHLQVIRIGTKALSYWPYRFLTDKDAGKLLDLFSRVNDSGKQLAFMAHINHPRELETDAAKAAIKKIRDTGTVIRTQSPLMRHINDSPEIWANMWTQQVKLGLVPYYMFLARDTGAQDYFAVPLAEAFNIFRDAYRAVGGLSRTIRGPIMSAEPGKVQISGITNINGEEVFVLNFLQARNPDWVQVPFFAKYDENAIWLTDLQPAFGESDFFFRKIDDHQQAFALIET